MKYAFLVAWREYAESAKAKGFWLSIFLMPLILLLSIEVPVWLEKKATPTRYYILVDQSGQFAPVIDAALQRHREPRPLYQEVPLPKDLDPQADLGSLVSDLKPYLRGERRIQAQGSPVELYAAILIPKDLEDQIVRPHQQANSTNRQTQYWSKDAASAKAGFGLGQEIEQAINAEVRRREYLAKGVDSALVGNIEHTFAPFVSLNPKKEAGQEAVTGTDVVRQWAPSGFVYLLWLAIFIIIQMLLNNTIEEKSNRIIEVLLSSVTPGELMMGKLFGIAAIGLTMIGAWMAALFGILSWKAGGASEMAGQLLVVLKASNLIPLFALYFLLGYLMYAAIILSIGSVCNTIKEAQSYMGLLTVVLMVPLMTMTYIPKDPNGAVARLLSWIPLYTPFTMMNRANADPPLLDLFGTFILLLASTATALWMCGKIFRLGILRTGQPPKIIEMLRWALQRSS